eukprot:2089759-Rhodomonas_salina.1
MRRMSRIDDSAVAGHEGVGGRHCRSFTGCTWNTYTHTRTPLPHTCLSHLTHAHIPTHLMFHHKSTRRVCVSGVSGAP